jgi:aldose 1-epimerase
MKLKAFVWKNPRKAGTLSSGLALLLVLFLTPPVVNAAQFTASKTVDGGITVIHLKDSTRALEADIVPAFGNRAIAFRMHGKNILYFPQKSLQDFAAKPDLNGVPFLAPWANRLDGSSYWVNDKEYRLNPALKNYGIGNADLPIHGLLSSSPLWEVTELKADGKSAHVTSRLRFWKYPELMAQWPFAQEYEMTYRLADGALEVRTSVINMSAESIPIAIGFHPYYRIPDKPRDEWTTHLPVRKTVEADERLVPTGEQKPADLPDPLPLKDRRLDNGFTDLIRDDQGLAHFSIDSGSEKIEILFGPKYPVTVVWEPRPFPTPQDEFFCIEPMTGVTNAINLFHQGKHPELQTVPSGQTWTESFWIKPSGF